ncbi:MAG: hypothetical protein LBE92_17425 [Chryseobacterium sp.]|jgi:hypothetical protein|uniref:hypothetical protein n=1 Tax=Chryseobacterium sp. TaxID=1871047 RepID=UPI00281FF047|nr:hypothetical protein [Chryseobacterium sp.]MDR2237908.1 hypothetical protein [Chryseobacterium sp.]
MNFTKKQLENLISKEKTIGLYRFDEDRQCFFGDVEVELYIRRSKVSSYHSVYYYFGGYEIFIPEEKQEIYEGDESSAKQQAIDRFNGQDFMGFPVIFENITCEIDE